MIRIKRFIDCYIPTETCNLRCHYCYITQKRKFNNKLASFSHSIDDIKKAFSFERMGGVCLINFCAGGETLLSNEVLPLVEQLINEGHYVMIVTNGTVTERFIEISNYSEFVKSHLFIKFSLQYLELLRKGWLDKFSENVKIMRDNKVSFTVEVTPSDELIPHIEELKKYCMQNFGALCHVTIARDDRTDGIDVLSKLDFNTYKTIWNQFDSSMFKFKSDIFYKKRNEFCYAGDWSLSVNIETGQIRQCYCGKIIGNLYDFSKPISFAAIGKKCELAHCFNGHAFLTLGTIPELETITYADTRNRICLDGTEWLQPEIKEMMESKLNQANIEYSAFKKWKVSSNHSFSKILHNALRKGKHILKR